MSQVVAKMTSVRNRRGLGEWLALTALIVFALLFRLYCLRSYDVMSADGTSYALAGKAFTERWSLSSFGIVQPPMYPALVGLFYLLVRDMELAARLVSVVCSTLIILPLYLLAREMFGRMAAIICILLFVTLPFLHSMSGIDITEPTYTLFAITGGYLFLQGWQKERKRLFLFAGFLLGLAYLSRPEGFIASFAITCCFIGMKLTIDRGWGLKKILLSVVIFWTGFIVFAFPYLNYLHQSTGSWQLSGKGTLNANIIKEYRGFAAPDQHMRVDADGKPIPEKGGILDLLANEPAIFWLNVRENLKCFPEQFTISFPAYLWPLVLLGLFSKLRERQLLAPRVLLLAICAPIVLYILYFIQPRGFYAYVPVLLVFSGGGFARVDAFIRRDDRPGLGRLPIALTAALALSGYYFYVDLPKPKPPYSFEQDGGRFDDKQVGLRLRTILPEGASIMTRSGRVAFYSQRRTVAPPQGSLEEVIAVARKEGAAYLIANEQLMNVRPQLEFLFQPLLNPYAVFTPPPSLELVYMGQEPGGTPYLVYHIKGM